MKYHAYPPYNIDASKSKFDFRKIFNNDQWQRVPYHAKNIIINLGHLIDNNYFHKSYVTNKNEPRRLVDIYKEQNNYFDYVVKYLTKFEKLEKDPGTKKAYLSLIDLVKGKKHNLLKIKKKVKPAKRKHTSNKKTVEKFLNLFPNTASNRFLFIIATVILFLYFSSK